MIRRRDMLGLTSLAVASAATLGASEMLRGSMKGITHDRMLAPEQLPSGVLEWHLEPGDPDMVSPVEFDGAYRLALDVYDRITAARYVSAVAPTILLNLAYRRSIRQEDRFHWPEVCYTTQGYDLSSLPAMQAASDEGPLFRRFIARSQQRAELVAYHVSIGAHEVIDARELRWTLLQESLRLRIPDGLLFRACVEIDDPASQDMAWNALSRFLASLMPIITSKSEETTT